MAGETHRPRNVPGICEVAKKKEKKLQLELTSMRAEEVHAKLYKEALENIDSTESFLLSMSVCGNIEKFVPDKCNLWCSGDKFIVLRN